MNTILEEQILNNKQQLLQKINGLIIGERKRYIQQYGQGDRVSYRTVSNRSLIDRNVTEHIVGEKTYGCYYNGKLSKFLCFDIDEPNPENPLKLIQGLLEVGFEKRHLHLENSGSKGWHLWIFFESYLPITELVELGNYILTKMGIKRKTIELRPENPKTSRGIKLPFGIHRKVMVRTIFIGHDLEALENPVTYFLNIEPTESMLFHNIYKSIGCKIIEDTSINIKIPVKVKPSIESKILSGWSFGKSLVENGMKPEMMTTEYRRHYFQLFVILYYKQQGLGVEEATKAVIEWGLNERRYGRSKSSEDEIKLDVTADVKRIYKEDKSFNVKSHAEIIVSQSDIDTTLAYTDLTTRRIVWGILLLGRMFHQEGVLFFSIRKLENITGCKRYQVHSKVVELRERGFIELREQGCFSRRSPKASSYYVPSLVQTEPINDGIKIVTKANTFSGLYVESFAVIQQLYDKSQLVGNL